MDIIATTPTTNVGSTSAQVFLYAGKEAKDNGQYMYHVASSNSISRSLTHHALIGQTGLHTINTQQFSTWLGRDQLIPPTWDTNIFSYSNFYAAPLLDIYIDKILLRTTSLYLELRVTPKNVGASIAVDQTLATRDHHYHMFRFNLEGVNVPCGTVSARVNSNVGVNNGIASSAVLGFTCASKNHFIYDSYAHTTASGTGSGNHRNFANTFYNLGPSFEYGEEIIFYITMTGIPAVVPAVDPSWTRDWVGAKVQLTTSYLT